MQDKEINLIFLRRTELEILILFRNLCQKNGLKYFITAGTLLGAVRHKGFIPWDDDIDVAMPRRDYEKLKRIFQNQPHDGYFLQYEKTEKNYPFCFAKLRKNGIEIPEPALKKIKMHNGISIDIFPLDKCPESPAAANVFYKAVALLNCCIMSMVNPDFRCGYTKKYMVILYKIIRRFPKGICEIMRNTLIVIFGLFSSGKRLCTVGGSHGFPRETYKAEWFSKSTKLEFEGDNFTAPCGWNELLTNMYGDYMTPQKNEHITHFIMEERQ